MRAKEREEAHGAFVAQMLWYLNRVEHERMGKKFEHPTWLDMLNPKEKDKRSGFEIKEEVKARAKALLERRKGGK